MDQKKKLGDDGRSFLRLSWRRRLEHHAGALLFIALAVTGLAQRFHGADWAERVILALGGIDSSRLIHRWAGLAFGLLTLQHVLVALWGVVVRHWRASMVINRKDFQDVVVNLKYYLGLVDRPARCDRYDYRQKFEYWGVLLGGLLMIATGFILWFPIEFFRLFPFLPGQIVPAAKTAHSNEAMLALLVIVVWHIYNSVFSPEVFPLDTTIFTGRISERRMIHEHPLEYERITGRKLEEPPQPRRPPAAADLVEEASP